MSDREIILDVKNLTKWFVYKNSVFNDKKQYVKAVDDVSFSVYKGETLGIVGESGCGKSTLARSILRLIEPTSGDITYRGGDFRKMQPKQVKTLRRNLQIIFQDPYGSLHPKMRIRKILEAPLVISKWGSKKEIVARVNELIEQVDLKPEHLGRYPHEFSGGQRQRIVIARALATNPELVICDEPVSALDVSVRSQILNLLKDIQDKLGLTYIFISHDLSVVEHICDRVIVMYLGRIAEIADAHELFTNPRHPYTKALLSATPQIYAENRVKQIPLDGDVPSPANPPMGCRFHTRCKNAQEICKTVPELNDIGNGHLVACHFYEYKENTDE